MDPSPVNAVVAAPAKWQAERRQRRRNKIFTPAYTSFHGANALDLHEILDLHEDGFCAQAPATVDLNQSVSFRLILSEAEGPLSADGRVAWFDRGRLGIQFGPLSTERLMQLQRWLFLNAMNAAADENGGFAAGLASIEEPAVLVDRSSLLSALDAVEREVVSLTADRDAALRLIAQRAQAFTAATGSAIAVVEGDKMVCRGTSGNDAPPLGASFQSGSGFSSECVRRRTLLRCDDAETDLLVDTESCRALGIRSILAVPLICDDCAVGVVEVFSPNRCAFHAREEEIVKRIAKLAIPFICTDEVDSTASTELSFPFAESLRQDTHSIPLRRSHILLLIAVAALVALVLGYILAPWLQRFFASPSPAGQTIDQPPLKSVALSPSPRAIAPETTKIATMLKLAQSGDPAAQFSMGTHYAIGDGVKLDSVEAAHWFTLAAQQGHVLAQDMMGAYYQAGRGVPKDLQKAYFWSLLGRAGNNQTCKSRVSSLSALLTREQIEAGRQDAERWMRQRAPESKQLPPSP